MPVARYFLSVGGVLLALLFLLSAYLPKPAEVASAENDLPVIRIHSDRKWPERVVFDTNHPTVVPVQVANTQAANTQASNKAVSPQAPAIAEVSAKARLREAFAQQLPSDARPQHASEAKKPAPKLPPKRKIAKRRAAPPVMLVAQQPQQQPPFGFFANNTW
jgi:hypothetical protein